MRSGSDRSRHFQMSTWWSLPLVDLQEETWEKAPAKCWPGILRRSSQRGVAEGKKIIAKNLLLPFPGYGPVFMMFVARGILDLQSHNACSCDTWGWDSQNLIQLGSTPYSYAFIPGIASCVWGCFRGRELTPRDILEAYPCLSCMRRFSLLRYVPRPDSLQMPYPRLGLVGEKLVNSRFYTHHQSWWLH